MSCTCCNDKSVVSEIIARHGTLDEFRVAVTRAVPSFISFAEADAAVNAYAKQLREAPTPAPTKEGESK